MEKKTHGGGEGTVADLEMAGTMRQEAERRCCWICNRTTVS
jgi:hypothetical protein